MIERFYLGVHRPYWLGETTVPLFLTRRLFRGKSGKLRRVLPRAAAPWVLDSGGFTELGMHGGWSVTVADYASEVALFQREIGMLEWAAPMDWMCEPSMLERTGFSVREHQALTIANFLELRDMLGSVIVPVLQGWLLDDYARHVAMYDAAGVDLSSEPVVGVGSVCRRGQDDQIVRILNDLAAYDLQLHAFGVRSRALARAADCVRSADSMAWSYDARKVARRPGYVRAACGKKACNNCLHYGVEWHGRQLDRLNSKLRPEVLL